MKGEGQGQSKGSRKADYQLNISTNVVQMNYRKYKQWFVLGAIHPIHPRFLWAFHFVTTTNIFSSKVERTEKKDGLFARERQKRKEI